MNKAQLRALPRLLALALTLLTLWSVGLGLASGPAQAAAQAPTHSMAQGCDGNRLIHAATDEYRMLYDYGYASAQRIEATTNEYRMLYDSRYASAQRIAAATDSYCDGIR